MPSEIIGVVGAGVMGSALAQSIASAGFAVILVDHSPQALERARGRVRQQLRAQRLLRGTPGAAVEEVLARIEFSQILTSLSGADLVIENVPEKPDIKQEVFGNLDRTCRPACVLAANTSCISITWLGSLTARPDRVVGLHFMNPVWSKLLVEVVRGAHTSEATLARARSFLARLGKESLVVEDSPGFVINRVLMLAINEAVFLVQEKVAATEDVDTLFRQCVGHKMGPLETADLIGLDTVLDSLQVLATTFGDPKFRAAPLLRRMVDAGLLGRKSGKGFYRYDAGDPS